MRALMAANHKRFSREIIANTEAPDLSSRLLTPILINKCVSNSLETGADVITHAWDNGYALSTAAHYFGAHHADTAISCKDARL